MEEKKLKGKGKLEADILDKVLGYLKDLPISEDDLKKPKKFAHEKVVQGLSNFVSQQAKVFITQAGERFMDVTIRRSDFWHDRILFAAEVDTWDFPLANWAKLMDTRADYRVWVFLIPDDKAEERFARNLAKSREMMQHRGEDASELSPFVFALKIPSIFLISKSG